ncbi:1-acyl-sn-glycerol-3-phosphate acyltransferase [Pontimonas sp.]|jgi:1-acyl-sn-glycerol-3-phosphate acyltransferase|nr:lysophospholipid acyltransferase family protein [Pontimonas sp.]MDA8909803.1 1-acyl-sn-glycerol-3-phosphate acyltransferase [Pontimonas sp.]
MFYWLMKHWVIGPLLTTVFRPWVTGLENIPRSGPAIVVSNHLSLVDSLFLPMMVDRQMAFLAKSDYFTGKGLKGWLIRFFMTSSGQLPIDRSGGKASEASLQAGLAVLAEGKVLAIYPEGTRSPDGRLYRGRTGVARMVLEAGVPVIPTVMIDTDKVMPLGSSLPKVHRVGVVIGAPLDFSRFQGMEGDRFVLRSITDEIIHEMHALGSQEYDDVYASTIRNASA